MVQAQSAIAAAQKKQVTDQKKLYFKLLNFYIHIDQGKVNRMLFSIWFIVEKDPILIVKHHLGRVWFSKQCLFYWKTISIIILSLDQIKKEETKNSPYW